MQGNPWAQVSSGDSAELQAFPGFDFPDTLPPLSGSFLILYAKFEA
jgi:hypothetical protein